jgi:hypothetical protein
MKNNRPNIVMRYYLSFLNSVKNIFIAHKMFAYENNCFFP